MNIDDSILSSCLFFTSNRFARSMTKMAEDAFAKAGLSPSYFYVLVVIHQYPGITQKELSDKLSIAPSTSTRFIDKLEEKQLVQRKSEWKETHVFLTDEGKSLYQELNQYFEQLNGQYVSLLGKEHSEQLTKLLHESSEILKRGI
ncbi:MarR family winged helix-turn-helix transcriptional regulator [Paenibacillus sp. MDMC362]|uniref:MarR family winged helix-turn-helix transcriptional regulator n=1 Tax=Paenibacillus sp. MDMC362 TaxID=2977365 RepID=UPI000DC296EC|nr:MarR family transcriptional regulator [Paenibacillus sp. MDMC362]RAR45643.1 MarR family transcriptional regulator [Paenibacillus sp. MDMC362]